MRGVARDEWGVWLPHMPKEWGGMGLGPTKVWSYGSVDHPETFNYPAFTIEAAWRRPVRRSSA